MRRRRRRRDTTLRDGMAIVGLLIAFWVAIIGAIVWIIDGLTDLIATIIVNHERKKKTETISPTGPQNEKSTLLPALQSLEESSLKDTENFFIVTGDDLIDDAIEVVVETGLASTALLQRQLKVGYARAARLIDDMEQGGIVGPFDGAKPRQVLLSQNRYNQLKMSGGIPRIKKSIEEEQKETTPIIGFEKETTLMELFQDVTSTLNIVDKMDGIEFEDFTVKLLDMLGYENTSVTKASGDQGVDVLACRDGLKYAIQCKNYSTPLGNDPIQEVFTGKDFYGCHVAVVVTNSTFTSGARALADKTGTVLWDREMLCQMIEKAISTKQQVTV